MQSSQQSTAYDLLLRAMPNRASLGGAVDVLSNPAVASPATARPATSYTDRAYSNSDDVHLGISSGSPGGLVHAAGTAVLFTAQPADPFKPHAFIIPSSHSWELYIRSIQIGSWNGTDGDDVPAEAHSEVSLSQFVEWPTIQQSQPIRITMWNQAPWNKRYALDLRGTRLRQ